MLCRARRGGRHEGVERSALLQCAFRAAGLRVAQTEGVLTHLRPIQMTGDECEARQGPQRGPVTATSDSSSSFVDGVVVQ